MKYLVLVTVFLNFAIASTQTDGAPSDFVLSDQQKKSMGSWISQKFDASTFREAKQAAEGFDSVMNLNLTASANSEELIFHKLHSVTPAELEAISLTHPSSDSSRAAHRYLHLRNQYEQDSPRFIASIIDYVDQNPLPLKHDALTAQVGERIYCLLSRHEEKILAWKFKGATADIFKIEPNLSLDGVFEQFLVLSHQKDKAGKYITNRKNSALAKDVIVSMTEHAAKVTFLIKGRKTTYQLLCSDTL